MVYQKVLNLVYQYLPSTCYALGTVLGTRKAKIPEGCLRMGRGMYGAEEKAWEWRQIHDSESLRLLSSQQDDTYAQAGWENKIK